MYLKRTGSEVTKGFIETEIRKKSSMYIRADSAVEFNEIMSEIVDIFTGLTVWEIKKMLVLNRPKGVELEFRRHNPDGTGTSLYLYRAHKGKKATLYPDVLLSTQLEYCGLFKNRLAHCTAAPRNMMMHACAIEKGIKKGQIKRRRKK